ncbi:MAG TPA: hypothetical protein VJ972_06815 [Anaerolineales bacterium]|nr:hypothetical protein [Anaerolineales bacterium]
MVEGVSVRAETSSNETQAASLPWYKVWAYAYISPTEKTYRNLIQDPKANSNRASIWVGASQGGIAIIYMLLAILFGALIGAPIMMFISASITHWLATKLGGEGTSDQIAFLLGAIIAPGYLIDSVVEGVLGNNRIGLGIRIAFFLYQGFLLLIAIKAVYTLSLLKAIGVVLLIALLIALVLGCLVGFMALL